MLLHEWSHRLKGAMLKGAMGTALRCFELELSYSICGWLDVRKK